MPAVVLTFVNYLLIALWVAIFARALLSWFDPAYRNPFSRVLFDITEPILAPIRRLLPAMPIDFSPLIALVVIGIIRSLMPA